MKARFAIAAVSALVFAMPALAAEGAQSGFYGGIALRDNGATGRGLTFGQLDAVEWGRFTAPLADDAASRKLMFGGYRWQNDVALEASVATVDRYTLRATDALGRSGVGLAAPGLADDQARNRNVDVFGSWTFWRSLALYGRLGYAQSSDASAVGAPAPAIDPRRSRDGVNYGVGMRYDMTPSLGLKLEYARFPRFPGESVSNPLLPDSDQVQFGLQYRF